MKLPRPYMSWSSYFLFKRSPKEWVKRYVYGEKGPTSKWYEFGKMVSLAREEGIESNDPMVQHLVNFVPSYPHTNYEMTATVMIDGKKVKLLGKFDGVDLRAHIIGEDKSGLATHVTKSGNISKEWNQKKVDTWEQLTWYSYIYKKSVGRIPRLRLHWFETVEKNGEIQATGNVKTFSTTRTVRDFIVLQANINKVYRGMIEAIKAEEVKAF